jgi:hypothetical protein
VSTGGAGLVKRLGGTGILKNAEWFLLHDD